MKLFKKWRTTRSTNTQEQQPETSGTLSEKKDNKHSFERVEIPETPFVAIYDEKHGWFATMGDHRLTEPVETLEQLKLKLTAENWSFLTTVIAVLTEKIIDARVTDLAEEIAQKVTDLTITQPND